MKLYKIRPLKWERETQNKCYESFCAKAVLYYKLYRYRDFEEDEWGNWILSYYFNNNKFDTSVNSLKEGKKLAKEDLLRHIMPALKEV